MANASNSYYTPSVDELPFKFSVASPVADRTRTLPPQLHFLLASGILLVNNSGSPATMANSSDCSLAFASSSPSSGCRRDVIDLQNRLIRSISTTLKVAPFDQEVSIHHMIRATKASEETPTRTRARRLDTWKHMYKNAARNASVLKQVQYFSMHGNYTLTTTSVAHMAMRIVWPMFEYRGHHWYYRGILPVYRALLDYVSPAMVERLTASPASFFLERFWRMSNNDNRMLPRLVIIDI